MLGNRTMPDRTLVRAAEATAKLKVEIDQLWSDAVATDHGVVSDRLVTVSHAIHNVCNLLDEQQVIG